MSEKISLDSSGLIYIRQLRIMKLRSQISKNGVKVIVGAPRGYGKIMQNLKLLS